MAMKFDPALLARLQFAFIYWLLRGKSRDGENYH
jgi:hypothetical protein